MSRFRLKILILVFVAIGGFSAIALLITTLPEYRFITYKSADMEPAIGKNETVLITNKIVNIRRGNVVIFKYPADQSQSFIKRVVGLPGELVEIREGRVFVDQKPLEERYVDPKLNTWSRSIPARRIPEGSYYVLGDNRDASNDSRYWGHLSAELIYGRVIFK